MALVPIMCRYGFLFPVSCLGQCQQKQNRQGLNPHTLAVSEVYLHSYPYTTRDCWSEVQKSRYLCVEFHVSCILCYMFHVAVNRMYMPGFMFLVSCFISWSVWAKAELEGLEPSHIGSQWSEPTLLPLHHQGLLVRSVKVKVLMCWVSCFMYFMLHVSCCS